MRSAVEQAGEGVGEGLDAFQLELLRHLIHVNARAGQLRHRLARLVILAQRALGDAVILEGDDGLWRHRVDRLRADQLLDIDHVAVRWILRAGAGPETALW